MTTTNTGDLFAFPLPSGEWMCARIMLDVHQQCVRPGLIAPGSPLVSFPKALLIDVYRSVLPALDAAGDDVPADVLIPGIFVSTGCFENGVWHVVGHRDVDPATVEFPEALVNRGPQATFVRGEVELPIEISFGRVREINAYKTEYPCGILGEIALCQLGRAAEIDKPEAALALRDLRRSDLRYSEHRHWIYEQLGEDEDQPYDRMARRMGHDLSRFYP